MTETKAAGLGAELRSARQAQGWELPQLAASLRIRQSYLEAIEAGRVADLPGTTYALGFVRAYASALGLPGEEVAKRFRSETTQAHGEQPALRFPAPVPQRGLPAGALMLLGVGILAAAYGGWYWVTEHRATPVEMVPPIPDRMVTETQKALPSPQVASLLPATAPPAASPPPRPQNNAAPAPLLPAPGTVQNAAPPPGTQTQAQPVPASQVPLVQTPVEGTAPAAGQAAPPASVISATPPQSAPTGAPGQPAPNAQNGGRIVIRATADAWVTVKQTSGPPVFNKLLHAGDSWPVPADKDGLTLTTGNAGGTQIDVDGAPIPTALGGSGAVRRDLPLDADMLKSGKLPPAPSRHPKPAPAAPPGE
jgi:cytoskeleton protein RodZ